MQRFQKTIRFYTGLIQSVFWCDKFRILSLEEFVSLHDCLLLQMKKNNNEINDRIKGMTSRDAQKGETRGVRNRWGKRISFVHSPLIIYKIIYINIFISCFRKMCAKR